MNRIIVLSKPYNFEGKEYTEIDLNALEDLNTRDIIEAEKEFTETGQFEMMKEMTVGFSMIVASKATKLPTEFFIGLPAKYGFEIKNTIMAFFGS